MLRLAVKEVHTTPLDVTQPRQRNLFPAVTGCARRVRALDRLHRASLERQPIEHGEMEKIVDFGDLSLLSSSLEGWLSARQVSQRPPPSCATPPG